MTPKDWNTQEEAIAAAKAEILAAIGDADARLELGMVKSVQRGTARLYSGSSSGSTSITVNISAVNTAKCIILLSGDGILQLYTTAEGTIYGARAEFISDTKLKILETYNKYVNEINWQVVEFY